MSASGVIQIVLYFIIIAVLTKPVGLFLTSVYQGKRTFLHPLLRWLEVLIYRLCGIREQNEQRWTHYSASLLAFSLLSFAAVYLIQRLQGMLPWNPAHFSAANVSPDLAFNTALSFVTNTNWQNYSGESTLSYFVQMAALTVQNFASAATGIAVALVLIRAFSRQESKTVGNFWADLTRSVVYVLLPISFIVAIWLCSQGVIQNLDPPVTAHTLSGAVQTIPQGPVASQEAIKMLGTNGGGFFNANSAHPYENPTPATNFIEMLLIFLIPAGLTYTFGKMVGDTRQGWALFSAMSVMFLIGVFVAYGAEQRGNPQLAKLGVQNTATPGQPGGNMEGKETRFGIAASALFSTITTDASCGAVNNAHDSLMPLGGLVVLFNLMTGEVIFGGVGAGLYGMLLFAIVAVFIAGLMVGRTPEYIGKKIEQREVKMTMLSVIATALAILLFAGIGSVISFPAHGYWNPPGPAIANLGNGGPHGFAELLYAYTSAAANNGSAFAGISGNTPWYNITLGMTMLVGRFFFLLPLIAAAGSLAGKKRLPETSGTLPTHGPLFVGLLVGTVVIVGALTYFPALSLGPVVEHFLVEQGKLFSLLLIL
ncbi:MAG: potassium-transporting ATPase subunit KdpA [Bryobacteraceae bacterium]